LILWGSWSGGCHRTNSKDEAQSEVSVLSYTSASTPPSQATNIWEKGQAQHAWLESDRRDCEVSFAILTLAEVGNKQRTFDGDSPSTSISTNLQSTKWEMYSMRHLYETSAPPLVLRHCVARRDIPLDAEIVHALQLQVGDARLHLDRKLALAGGTYCCRGFALAGLMGVGWLALFGHLSQVKLGVALAFSIHPITAIRRVASH